MKLLVIGIGGFLGAIMRYSVSKAATLYLGNLIPFGTLIVNGLGSFLLGYLYVFSLEKSVISENMRFFIGVGFMGAFTTFSTFSVETVNLYEDGAYFLSLLNIFLNVGISLFGAFIGMFLAKL